METTVNIRLPADVADDLKARAEADHRSLSNYLRLILIAHLDAHNRRYVDESDIPA
jgi:hypothetical protein